MSEEEKKESVGQHHHHHHSHHHKSKKKKSRSKFWNLVGKYKLQLAGVAVFFVLLITLIAVALNEQPPEDGQGTTVSTQEQPTQPSVQVEAGTLSLKIPHFSEPLTLIGQGAQAYMNAPITAPVADVLDSYHQTGQRLDVGAPVNLSFEVLSLPGDCTVVASKVEISERTVFTKAWSYDLAAKERSVELWNLKTGTVYHYRVTVYLSDGTENGAFGSFETASGPRIFNINGLHNARDVGGWTTTDGKTLLQGLLYRGAAPENATQEGRDNLTRRLAVRNDMDLRGTDGDTPLGANVEHSVYAVQPYTGIFTAEGSPVIRNLFADLADRDNYPAYLHCTDGTDRTGTVCYLLQALLGVSEEDLIRDFELSALMSADVNRTRLKDMVNRLETYDGDTMQENVENYLLEIGVTPREIAAIRDIWLG
ncbi:MAG: tyrosine-protein phosphatase [Oscillospiraceae bacterium]|nr:tyrosine-protein phosphatase [Oscillospiraceae bacterium]